MDEMQKETGEEKSEKKNSESTAKAFLNDACDIIESVISSVFIVLLIFTFLFRIATVSGTSMLDTLLDGDKLIISSLAYTPQAGDVVIVNYEINGNDYIVKRVVATEGQTVSIRFTAGIGSVFVDGVQLNETYIREPMTRGNELDVVVGANQVFVMGDNRNNSTDSRIIGCVDESSIVGKVVLRYFPFDTFGLL